MSRAKNQARRHTFAGDRSWRSPVEPLATGPDPVARGDLRQSFDLADIDRAARIAVSIIRYMPGDYAERYELAWSAAAEHLAAADQPVTSRSLVEAATAAASQWVAASKSMWGVATGGDAGSAPRFITYWSDRAVGGHEDRLVESIALGQIWPQLTETQRQAITALAAHDGDLTAAAAAMGVGHRTFLGAVYRARVRYRELWHEGERPSGHWAQDRQSLRRDSAPGGARRAMRAIKERRPGLSGDAT